MRCLHRAHFLDELVKAIPAENVHFNKHLRDIEDIPGVPNTIHFNDGTSATADIVIGADGIHSTVRAYLLGC